MPNDTPAKPSTPAEKAMTQTSKTAAELGDEQLPESEDDDPVGPNDGPTVDHGEGVSEGDRPVGQGDSDGSSPYEEPNHLAKKQRSN